MNGEDTIFKMIRESVISLNLFEDDKKSLKHLLILTDAQFPIDDGINLDRCINLLRYCTICCSFIHIKTTTFTSITDQSYDDQLKFIANVTGGFYKTPKDFSPTVSTSIPIDRFILRYRYFDQSNYFDIDSVSFKKFTDRTINSPPLNLIFTFINMGYILNSVNCLRDSRMEIELILQWRSEVNFKVVIITRTPLDIQRKCVFSLFIFGQSYFLREIPNVLSSSTHQIDQHLFRYFRGQIMKDIKHTLNNVEFFSLFNTRPIFVIPNFINNGLKPMLSPTNQPCDKIDKNFKQFFDFWIRTLEFTHLNCFHTTRINILLEHDFPFPDFLTYPDPLSKKYNSIQGRESLVQLSGLINKNFCDFIVKENNTYVKFFIESNSNKVPNHFCLIKMSCQDLDVKILLHFFIPTPETIRNTFTVNLINKIRVLKFQPRGKQARPRHMSSHQTKNMQHVPPQQRSWEQINCCTILSLDLNNLVALYNPIIHIDSQNKIIRRNKMTLSLAYLHNHCYHNYKIWIINELFSNNIFEMLIKIRLQEGFHIAVSDSTSGFINLIKEIQLINNDCDPYKCFIQYLIYPESFRSHKDSEIVYLPDDMASLHFSSGVKKIFTEIFIEKKYGKIINTEPEVIHWEGLTSNDIPNAITDLDLKSIETFVTFECFKIYPMTLDRGLVKPNVCSVLNKSPRYLIHCPLFLSNSRDNFASINSIFMEALDNNLKCHGFHHIDITKTESANFNKLLKSYDEYQCNDTILYWNCYYTLKGTYLIVIMIPSNFLEINFQPDECNNLQIFLYGMSLKHLTFLIEDHWTLKLPESNEFYFPLVGERKLIQEFDKVNEFGREMEEILNLMEESVKKLESIYLLTFVGGIHKNLVANNQLNKNDLDNTFLKYCSELSFFYVDATKFINTICSHCNNGLKSNPLPQQPNLGIGFKECCEVKHDMHNRIVNRIRQMMAKYFKEVPSFPQILIYYPGNDSDFIDYNDFGKNDEIYDDIIFCRQKSVDQYYPDNDYNFIDNGSEVKSVSSTRQSIQSQLCPLFISINYTLQYDNVKKYLKFDNIPTCIGDFMNDLKLMVDGEIDFQKLRFSLDMIPITYVDEDLSNLLAKTMNEDHSLEGEVNSSKIHPTEITKRYLTSVQTQLLEKCKGELIWTLEDEVVNFLKYYNVVDTKVINTVKQHIENTSSIKLQKNFIHEIQRNTFDLDFVFGFEKSKSLFQSRFEKITFGKESQYVINKIDEVYCVFQKRKTCSDQNALVFTLFPDQTFEDMEDICMHSRMRVDSLCMTSLQTASDNLKGDYLRRCSSEGKLNDLKSMRKMSESKRESVTLFDKIDNQSNTEQLKPEVNAEYRPINQYIRQQRLLLTSNCQSSSNQTPKRHRSGEASSIMYTANYRSETPMLLNDLISTATSSKGYEGDSSRVSEGEEYDRFSNCPTDIKANNMIQNEIAPFWLLLQIVESSKEILLYFHHSDTCTISSQDACEYCNIIDNIYDKIKESVHQVNQSLLLEQLAQTRICRDILVLEEVFENHPMHVNQMFDLDYDDDNSVNMKKFKHETFACPIILKIAFKLHPRLKGSTDKNSKAIPALRVNLDKIAILNRKNMLIFIDDNTNGIFYSLLNEVSKELNQFEIDQLINNSVLISEQICGDTNTDGLDIQERESFQLKLLENNDNISIKSAPVSSDFQIYNKPLKSMDLLELSIHGVDKLSDATIKSIIANIGSKLDSIVLRQLTESICRCSNIWLCKEDLDFLLSTDYSDKHQKSKFYLCSLPNLAIDNCLAFCYYLKQNLQTYFISPKISDLTIYERFNINKEMMGEVYLFNQSVAQGVANDAIVLLTVQLLSSKTDSSWIINEYSLPEFQEKDEFNLDLFIQNNSLKEIEDDEVWQCSDCYLKVSLWLRGHISLDVIKKKIYNIIQYAMNDLLLEFIIIPRHISTIDLDSISKPFINKSDIGLTLPSFEEVESGVLQNIFAEDLFNWFPELSKSESPLIKYRRTDMFSDYNVDYLINDLIEGMSDSIMFNAFSLVNESWETWCSKQPKSGKDFPGMKKSFILIGRLEDLWKKFVSKKLSCTEESNELNLSISQTSYASNSSSSTCPRKVRMLLKQQPFESSSLFSSLNSSTTTLHATTVTQNLPEFCHVQVSSAVIIPRQMLCIIKIMGCQVDIISYNLVKDTLDNLNNLVDTIVQNHKDRFQMMNSFIYQKLGLFQESINKSCFQSLNINVVKNLSQINKIKYNNLNISDVTRDRKPSGSPRSFSPSNKHNVSSYLNVQSKNNGRVPPTKRIQLNINVYRIYQDPYSIFSLNDLKKSESVNDVIYQYASQFLTTYNAEMKRRLLNKKIGQCLSYFMPKLSSNQSELKTSDHICALEQLDVFSSMKRVCRIFHSVICPILFIPYVRKRLLDLSNKRSDSPNLTEYDELPSIEEWMNVMSIKLLGCYAEYVQKEQGFQFVNPPRPNVTQNPCSYALFHKPINKFGIYLMEIFILKGCLCVRLSAFEYRRLGPCIPGRTQLINNWPPVVQQHQKIFIKDACKLCDLTHLYSFIYDFYVGMVVKSITNPEENKKFFNVISFLKDFVKMYSYPPMFACNHIYWMAYKLPSEHLKPSILFDFLVSHYEDYDFMLSNAVDDQSNLDTSHTFIYNICDEPLSNQNMVNIHRTISPSSSPLSLPLNYRTLDERFHECSPESDFASIFCLTKSTTDINSSFDLFIVTYNKTNNFPYQHLFQMKKIDSNLHEPTETILYPAKYLSILPHKSSSPDNMLHLKYCPISFNGIDPDQLPHSLAWKTFDNRSVIPLQIPLFLNLRCRIENYQSKCDVQLIRAVTDCHKDSLWHRMYHKPDSTNIALQFKEFQDLINSGEIVDILELDPRLVDCMKIATSYLKELDRCMSLLSDDCCTILYENMSSIYKSNDINVSTHLVLMSKNTTDGFLLLSKTEDTHGEDNQVQLKAIFRSQDCRNRKSPQSRYFSSSLRDVTVMLAETAAFCIWRKLTGKL